MNHLGSSIQRNGLCSRKDKTKSSLALKGKYHALERGVLLFGRMVLWSLALLLLVVLLLMTPGIQRWTAGVVGDLVSERLGVVVRMEQIMLRPFGPVEIGKVYIGDLNGDTLISVHALRITGLRILSRKQLVQASRLELNGARFALTKDSGEQHSNLTRLINALASEDTTETDANWSVRCSSFSIDDLHFSYHDRNMEPVEFGVDFDHVDVSHARIVGHQFGVESDTIHAHLESLSLHEQSGLELVQLGGAAVVSGKGIALDQMVLRTPLTDVRGTLVFRMEDWSDMNDFINKVDMRLDLDSSRLEFADVAYFAPGLEGIHFPIDVTGRIRGTIAELKGRGLSIGFGERSAFKGNVEMSGLPDIDNTFMLLDIAAFHTDHVDLSQVPIPPFTEGGMLRLPPEVRKMGDLFFEGNFTGFTRSFTAFGRSSTALGAIRTDISYERVAAGKDFTLSGRIATDGFRIGPLIQVPELGVVAANIRLQGSGPTLGTMKADLDGVIPLFTYGDIQLSGIKANGRIEPGRFNGRLRVVDENLVMEFKGLADLSGEWPQVDFSANVQHADLGALGITSVKDYNTLSVLMEAEGRLSPDSLLGRVKLNDISYCNEEGEHELGDILVTSGRRDGENLLTLVSTFAEGEVHGEFLPTLLPGAVESVLYSVFPVLRDEVEYDLAEQRFTFQVRSLETEAVLDLFVPGLRLDSGAVFSGWLDSRTFDIGFSAEVPEVGLGPLRARNISAVADKTLDVLAFSIHSERQIWNDSVWFSGTSLSGKAYQDELTFSLGWEDSNSGTNGALFAHGEVRGINAVTLDLLPSQLYFGRGNWMTTEPTRFEIDSTTVRIDSLRLLNNDQYILVDGTISKDTTRSVTIEVSNFSLSNLDPFIHGPDIKGRLNGNARLHGLYDAPFILSHLGMDSVSVRDIPVGDLRFDAEWAEGQRAIDLAGTLMRGRIKAMDFNGRMSLDKENKIDVDLLLDRFDLAFIDPYLPEGISDIQGLVTGTVSMTGTLVEPLVNGELELVDAGMRIDYLNTTYTFSHTVKVAPDMFALDLVTIRDEQGNTARVGGTVLHSGLRDWNYNFWGSMDKLQVLNTGLADNALYYGKAFATGDIELSGYAGSLEISVDARTAPGTDIHFPVGGSTEVSPIGFVHFTESDSIAGSDPDMDLSGISMDMNVEITPDALFELIFDPTVGDIMSGRGQGNMEMSVDQRGEFEMRGQVEVSEGDYLFTLRNVVNKRFQLDPGGRITWYGDPFDAQLDLRATYKVRAPLYDIMFEKNEAYRKRVPVEVVMNLKDKLMNPAIGFGIRLPTVDENVRTQVNSVISTEQELNRQVFSLIVLNRFVTPPSYSGQGTPSSSAGVAGTTTSELLSNQVSNWLSKLSNDFDLGVNYRPGDQLTQDELELAVSTQLFNERLLVSTNLGVQSGAQAGQNANTLVGDFQMEYLLTNDGKLRLKAFSVSNDQDLNRADQAQTTQGAGVAFREEFNTWGEFWQKVFNVFRSREKDRSFD